MRRTTVLLVACLLVVGPVGGLGEAKKRKKTPKRIERVATVTYDAPALGAAGVVSGGNCGSPNTGCANFTAAKREKYVTFEIIDGGGQPATGAIAIGAIYQGDFCGSTAEPLDVEPGVTYTVWVHNGPSPSETCPGVATSGSVRATFTNFK